MTTKQILQNRIGVGLIMLFLVGCGKEPVDRTTAPISAPATKPTPSTAEYGQARRFGIWGIRVLNTNQADSIALEPKGSYILEKGHTLRLVELELENTSDVASTLDADLLQIQLVDSNGKSYRSFAGIAGSATPGTKFFPHGLVESASWGVRMQSGSGGPTMTLRVTVVDENTKKYAIEFSGKGSAKLTVAFDLPTDVRLKELRWPNFPPFRLEQ